MFMNNGAASFSIMNSPSQSVLPWLPSSVARLSAFKVARRRIAGPTSAYDSSDIPTLTGTRCPVAGYVQRMYVVTWPLSGSSGIRIRR